MTEVIYDFVFMPPRAQIGFQSSVIPDTGTHLRTALFVFELGKSTYVTVPPKEKFPMHLAKGIFCN